MVHEQTDLQSRWLERAKRIIRHNWRLYLLLLPALVWLILFCYVPMYGVVIAFVDFKPKLGILGSPWVGLKWFETFFSTSQAVKTINNTVILSVLGIVAGFPAPIIFALLLNQITNKRYRKFIQTVSFAPHFISTVVMVSMMQLMLSPTSGILNRFLSIFTASQNLYMTRPEYFRSVYVISGVWQGMGFGAIVYIAALAGISPELHEAAIVDGASKLQRVLYIDIPGITPTMILMFIMSMGSVLSVGYEKAYLMQNTMNTSVSEIISTYTYKIGLLNARYSFSTAIGLFNSVVNFALLMVTNFVMGKLTKTSMF